MWWRLCPNWACVAESVSLPGRGRRESLYHDGTDPPGSSISASSGIAASSFTVRVTM